tara:strand:+ start:14 stop:199 length:186 start_codon:yes stop_codon:yes gene_type:complete
MKEVNLEVSNMFSSRDDIGSATEYFNKVVEATPKEHQFFIHTAFMVFWNTLAKNYTIHKKE